MKTYLITNQEFAATSKIFAGWSFHRPHGDGHREIKFITSKAQREILMLLAENGIEITEKEKTVN